MRLTPSFGIPSIPQAFFFFNAFINFSTPLGLIFGGNSNVWVREELELYPPPVFHGLCHTTRVN